MTSDDKDLPRFATKKWIEVYDQSEKNYNVNKEIVIKTPMLRSDLCDFMFMFMFMHSLFWFGVKYLYIQIQLN